MKILVFSDSHSYTDFMLDRTRLIQPDVLIHLGDYYRDADALALEFPHIPLYALPGNCDQYYAGYLPDPVSLIELDGIRLFLTHGHKHGVKYDLTKLKMEARRAGAQAVLFGHTHSQLICHEDGLWIINPGSCGIYTRDAVLITTADGKISHCAPIA